MNPEGVTWIVNHLKPHVQDYLDNLIDDGNLRTEPVHQGYEYPPRVTYQKCWNHFGIFNDYLVRREIYIWLGLEPWDKRAEVYKCALEEYDNNNMMVQHYVQDGVHILIHPRNVGKLRTFLRSYEIFQDGRNNTIDIVEHVWNTANMHMMAFGRRTMSFSPDFINWDNIADILYYANTLDLRNVRINPSIRGNTFYGDADLIFHNCIMDLKVSKYDPFHQNSRFNNGIYQMLFYALGNYIESGREIRTFKTYNPLLGVVHILHLRDLNFEELRWKLDNSKCWWVNRY